MTPGIEHLVALFLTASGGVVALLAAVAKLIAVFEGRAERRRAAEAKRRGETQEAQREVRQWELDAFKSIVETQREEIARCQAEIARITRERDTEAAEREEDRRRWHKEREQIQIEMLEHGMKLPNENGDPK